MAKDSRSLEMQLRSAKPGESRTGPHSLGLIFAGVFTYLKNKHAVYIKAKSRKYLKII